MGIADMNTSAFNTVELCVPVAQARVASAALARRLASLQGRRIALIDNGKPNAAPLLVKFGAALAALVPSLDIDVMHGLDARSLQSPQALIDQIGKLAQRPDAALVGVGD